MFKTDHKKIPTPIQKCVLIVLAAILLISVFGGVYAKYIHGNSGSNLFGAKEFYFTSNLLKEDAAKYVLNSNAKEVSFTLGNHEDKLRFSRDTIQYEVSVEEKDRGTAPEIQYSDAEKRLASGGVSETTVTLKNLEMGKTYLVTATGEAGYSKTLKAEFTVSDQAENVYKHLDTSNDAYLLLTVWTENVKGDLTVTAPANLVPDNTDPILETVTNYTGDSYTACTFTDNENFDQTYSSYTYRFFIQVDSTYSLSDFDITFHQDGVHYIEVESDL
ncbi:MAG: hypothetical protein IJN34_08010 [Clostridia bacterium]|nr:hypothetical protein [Clostridia bacterium]